MMMMMMMMMMISMEWLLLVPESRSAHVLEWARGWWGV
jgi:hypothetical protein